MPCGIIEDSPNLLPGWVCCQCRIYNGAQRLECRHCSHSYCGPCYQVTKTEPMISMTGETHTAVITKIRRL